MNYLLETMPDRATELTSYTSAPVDGDQANLTIKALEQDDQSSANGMWILMGVFGAVVVAALISAFWRVPLNRDGLRFIGKKQRGKAENLFLPVGLFHADPRIRKSAQQDKVYIRSLGFRKAVLLAETPIEKGDEIWIDLKNLPYSHADDDLIHGRVVSGRRLGNHWHVANIKIVHESEEYDRGLHLLIKDLQAVPG